MPVPTESMEQAADKRPASSQRNKLRKSTDAGRHSPEQKRPNKLPGPPPVKSSGIRRLFGTKKAPQAKGAAPNPPDSPVETNPSILAARRALEGKPSLQNNGTGSPPLSPGHFQKIKNAKSPMATVERANDSPAPRSVTPPQERALTPEPEPVLDPSRTEDLQAGPPRTRRDEEYDQLSRVDTNEREHADREFSTFDQGPLDQPAFVPQESPVKESYQDEKHRANAKSQSPIDVLGDDGAYGGIR